MMNELSLFSGAGGGLLATKHLLGWMCIGYVEWDEYCCKVLEQRIKDGYLDEAPIWQMDIREFNRRIAPKYRGVVDVCSAGFPCQPFSVAGKGKGEKDPRNQWPNTIECIRSVRPHYVFLENVQGLLSARERFLILVVEKVRQMRLFASFNRFEKSGNILRRIVTCLGLSYVGRILGDLAESGYDAKWCVLGANDVNAPHRRKRLWVVAYSPCK